MKNENEVSIYGKVSSSDEFVDAPEMVKVDFTAAQVKSLLLLAKQAQAMRMGQQDFFGLSSTKLSLNITGVFWGEWLDYNWDEIEEEFDPNMASSEMLEKGLKSSRCPMDYLCSMKFYTEGSFYLKGWTKHTGVEIETRDSISLLEILEKMGVVSFSAEGGKEEMKIYGAGYLSKHVSSFLDAEAIEKDLVLRLHIDEEEVYPPRFWPLFMASDEVFEHVIKTLDELEGGRTK